jgi:CheY-like chemotaxis protein
VSGVSGKVLIVEDDRLTRESLQDYLRLRSLQVLSSSTGEEGIALALRDQPNVILMDLGLPGMSGIEAAQVIRNDLRICKIPIIALTGRPRELWEEAARDAGVTLYLTKPVLLSKVFDAIVPFLSSPPATNGSFGR